MKLKSIMQKGIQGFEAWFRDAGVPMPSNESKDDLGLDTVEELKLFAADNSWQHGWWKAGRRSLKILL